MRVRKLIKITCGSRTEPGCGKKFDADPGNKLALCASCYSRHHKRLNRERQALYRQARKEGGPVGRKASVQVKEIPVGDRPYIAAAKIRVDYFGVNDGYRVDFSPTGRGAEAAHYAGADSLLADMARVAKWVIAHRTGQTGRPTSPTHLRKEPPDGPAYDSGDDEYD